MRSIGNCVGVPAFKNTNRARPAYRKKKDRIARRNGFASAAHQAIFLSMIANAQLIRKEEAK